MAKSSYYVCTYSAHNLVGVVGAVIGLVALGVRAAEYPRRELLYFVQNNPLESRDANTAARRDLDMMMVA